MIAHPATHLPPPPARVQVVAQEFSFTLSRLKVKSGEVIVELVNDGQDAHDLDIQRVGSTHIVHFPHVQPGAHVDRMLKLKPGTYHLWCDIANHRAMGMHATPHVTR